MFMYLWKDYLFITDKCPFSCSRFILLLQNIIIITINRLFKSADIEGGLVFTYKESMLYVKRSGVYFNIIPLHSGYIFKQGTGDIPNDAIELTIQ